MEEQRRMNTGFMKPHESLSRKCVSESFFCGGEKHMDNEKYMKRCYELAIRAGKKGFDTFGALLVHNGEILEETENTADWNKGLFGHAEFNLVHKCANRYSDTVLKESVLYTSCAPCERCLCAIASLGVENVVFGVSYEAFSQLTPDDAVPIDREGLLGKLGVRMKLTGPVLEDEGMHVFEWWGGEYRPLEELIAEMAEIRGKKRYNVRAGSNITGKWIVQEPDE